MRLWQVDALRGLLPAASVHSNPDPGGGSDTKERRATVLRRAKFNIAPRTIAESPNAFGAVRRPRESQRPSPQERNSEGFREELGWIPP